MKKSLFTRILPAIAMACAMNIFAADMVYNPSVENESTLETFLENASVLLDSSLHLDMNQTFGYNDNVDEDARSHRSSSWFSQTNVNADLVYNLDASNSFGLRAGVGYKPYFHRSKNDDTKGLSYYFGPVLNGSYTFGKNTLMVKAVSEYKATELDRSKRVTTMEAINGINLGWSNDITGKTTLALTADYTNKHFSDREYKGYNNQVYGVKFAPYWTASDRLRIGAVAGAERTSYNHKDLHDDKNRFNFGLYSYYQLSARTNIFAEAGAEQTKYQSNTVSKAASDDKFKFYAKAGLNYTASDDLNFRFAIGRSQEDSWGYAARGLRSEYKANLSATWQLTGKLTMTNAFAYKFNDEKTAKSDSDEYGYNLIFKYKYSDSISIKAGYSIDIVDYDHRKGDYVENEFSVGMTWAIK